MEIERKNLFSIPFYKKTHFSGSCKGMHFKIERAEQLIEGEEERKETIFKVTVWPGPYCLEKTSDEMKYCSTFPFSTEGLDQICDWLNLQYSEKEEQWKKVSMWN